MSKGDDKNKLCSIARWVLCLMVLGLSLVLTSAATPAQAFTAAQPLDGMLNPDGTLNLTTGFRGGLDVRGWQLISGPNEPPRFGRQAEPLAVPGNQDWASNFALRGTSSLVNGIALDHTGNVYAGGWFSAAGGVPANYVAKWSAGGWSALSNGTNYVVRAMATDASGNVYAGGSFTVAADPTPSRNLPNVFTPKAPAVSANAVAKWNGTSWSAMGSGLNGDVLALAVDGNGNVYAGGTFSTAGSVTVNYIAKWNGTAWSPMGNGLSYFVRALAVDSSNNIYAGGAFTNLCAAGPGCTPSTEVNYIAKWNGITWSPVGNGFNASVDALVVDSSGNVFAGGDFKYLCAPGPGCISGTQVNYIAEWTTGAWSALDHGFDNPVWALTVANNNVYAGGAFTVACDAACNPTTSTTVNYIAKWDGLTWSALSGGTSNTVIALARDSSNNVYVGGSFTRAGSTSAYYIARWSSSSSSWSALGSGDAADEDVLALAHDSSNNIYAAGLFSAAGNVIANSVAKWNGSTWSALGHGFNGWVNALAVDSHNNVYAGGPFTLACDATCGAASTPVNHIAKWNGIAWSAVGNGFNDIVRGLAVDSHNNVYAGGDFTNLCVAGPGCTPGAVVNHIAQWNGITWSAVGNGFDNQVNTLAVDSSNNVYVGGTFVTVCAAGPACPPGAVVNYIAQWNGASWLPLGRGLNNQVNALVVGPSNNVYAGGNFSGQMGEEALRSVARWDGTTWWALGNGINNNVYALALDGANLYAGGDFTVACDATCNVATSTSVNYIAVWDGNVWSPLGSGMNGGVRALATGGGTLYVGGFFTRAGGKISGNIGSVVIGETYLPLILR